MAALSLSMGSAIYVMAWVFLPGHEHLRSAKDKCPCKGASLQTQRLTLPKPSHAKKCKSTMTFAMFRRELHQSQKITGRENPAYELKTPRLHYE